MAAYKSKTELIRVEQKGQVLVLQIHRPEKKNALTLQMYEALLDAFAYAEKDSSVCVVMICGTQEVFTSGNDVKDFLQNPPRDENAPVIRFVNTLATFSKPLVAAVGGVAVGVGTTMLMHCDLVYASESAKFQFPFVNLALVPEAASSLFLPQLVGHQKAFELFCFGEMFDVEQAKQFRLVNQSFSAESLFEEAMKRCEKLAQKAPVAVRETKKLLRSKSKDASSRIQEEGKIFLSQLASKEVAEALQAFLEKRPANFTNIK